MRTARRTGARPLPAPGSPPHPLLGDLYVGPHDQGERVRIATGLLRQVSDSYALGAASATVFIAASPLSNWSPIIRSMLMTRWIALAMKFLSPVMLHVTMVRSPSGVPSGLNVNSATLVPAKGFTNSSLTRIRSLGWLSTIVIRPSPTSWLPTHV